MPEVCSCGWRMLPWANSPFLGVYLRCEHCGAERIGYKNYVTNWKPPVRVGCIPGRKTKHFMSPSACTTLCGLPKMGKYSKPGPVEVECSLDEVDCNVCTTMLEHRVKIAKTHAQRKPPMVRGKLVGKYK